MALSDTLRDQARNEMLLKYRKQHPELSADDLALVVAQQFDQRWQIVIQIYENGSALPDINCMMRNAVGTPGQVAKLLNEVTDRFYATKTNAAKEPAAIRRDLVALLSDAEIGISESTATKIVDACFFPPHMLA